MRARQYRVGSNITPTDQRNLVTVNRACDEFLRMHDLHSPRGYYVSAETIRDLDSVFSLIHGFRAHGMGRSEG